MAKRLLIIDDEPAFSTYVRRVAESVGYEVVVTADVDRFKAAYQLEAPTLVMVDLVLPGVGVTGVIDWLAAHGCKVPVVVATGFGRDLALNTEYFGRARGLNITHLRKPVSAETLRRTLLAP